MNDFSSTKTNNSLRSGLVFALILLLILEMCSVTVLFSQMTAYATEDQSYYISLTEGSPDGTVSVGRKDEYEGLGLSSRRNTYAPVALSSNSLRQLSADKEDPKGNKTGFKTYDEDQVWSTHTDIEIFSLRYDDNGDGIYTTVSNQRNGAKDKVFAPGTQQSYTFTLENTSKKALSYKLDIKAYYENDHGLWIPVEGRLSDYTGAWLVGSADEWPNVLKLDGYSRSGKLSAGLIAPYTLEWRWPFERTDGEGLDVNDAYDTMLGNLAVDEDITLHIIINTIAWVDEDTGTTPGSNGKDPIKTGDTNQPLMWAAVFTVVLPISLILLYTIRKDDKKRNGSEV